MLLMSWKSILRVPRRLNGWTLNSASVETKHQCSLVPNSCPISSINSPPLRILNWPRLC
uniref:Uncharacterized protein n=1 Tax=Medicago truncatula TaxID=3880 RepID=I3S0G6_MEDTR|nr:unknown [Medicago truncatula]